MFEQRTLSDEVYARGIAAVGLRVREGLHDSRILDGQPHPAVNLELTPHEDEKDEDLARACVAAQQTEFKFGQWRPLSWSNEPTNYARKYLPHKAWRIILLIWSMDQSFTTIRSLSAGEIENLLARNGIEMIEFIETEARRDPSFAKPLGGVWKNRMTDEVWSRLHAVCNRRGWDGIAKA